jgi:hypothetical protein
MTQNRERLGETAQPVRTPVVRWVTGDDWHSICQLPTSSRPPGSAPRRIASGRPVGNTDEDVDPSNSVTLTPTCLLP